MSQNFIPAQTPKEGTPHIPPYTVTCPLCKEMMHVPGIAQPPSERAYIEQMYICGQAIQEHIGRLHHDTAEAAEAMAMGNGLLQLMLSKRFIASSPHFEEGKRIMSEVLLRTIEAPAQPLNPIQKRMIVT